MMRTSATKRMKNQGLQKDALLQVVLTNLSRLATGKKQSPRVPSVQNDNAGIESSEIVLFFLELVLSKGCAKILYLSVKC